MGNNVLANKVRSRISMLLCLLMLAVSLGPLVPSAQATPANVIAGLSYVSSVSADASYPDSGGGELTDGITASALLADAAWQGRFNQSSYSFTVDMGSNRNVQTFEASFYKYIGAAVHTPTNVVFKYSTDNVAYNTACSLGQLGAASDIASIPYQCSAAGSVTARYVQMEINSAPGTWSFVDEWSVLESPSSEPEPLRLHGSFLQPEFTDQWSTSDWEDEFQDMADVGMNHLILQWSANTEFSTAVYPTTIAGLAQNTTHDIVAKTLEMGEEFGFDIYIGLQLNHEWFVNYTNDGLWLENEADLAGELVADLWAQYGSYTSFKGWYLSFEVDNWNLPTSTEWQRMADFYNEVTAVTSVETPGLPVMISPFYNVSGGLAPAGWEAMWSYILARTDIDIIALQDGIGAGHAATADLADWFQATLDAINVARPATELWADTETFNMDFKPMDLALMLDNMLAVEPYVSRFTSFSFNHYMSPRQVNPLYYETYSDYVATGAMDSAAPTTPTSLTATAVDAMTVSINWTASTDDTGVVGYHIYRNNERVHTDYTGAAVFVDRQLDASTGYTYAVSAFDAAGNVSDDSVSASVSTPTGAFYPNIWSGGKPYTDSMPANTAYPDTGGSELTDGSFGSAAYVDGAWQGRNTGSPYSFVVDLGMTQTISELNARFLQVKSVYVLLPKEVRFYVSADNVTFTEVGTVEKPAVSDSDQTKTYRLANLIGLTGRYFKVEVVPASSAWTFVDEIQARS